MYSYIIGKVEEIESNYITIDNNGIGYLIYQITNKIIEENDIIAIEDLDIKKMYQNHRIAKQLTLNPLNELVRVLKYKTEWKNKRFKNKEL